MIRFIFTTYNPQIGSFAAFDDPRVAKLLNEAIELSGMTKIDMTQKPELPQPSPIQMSSNLRPNLQPQ